MNPNPDSVRCNGDAGQCDPCRCRLDLGHVGPHWCEHPDALDPLVEWVKSTMAEGPDGIDGSAGVS